MIAERPTWLSAAETAKLVRKALKSSFPGVKFSVRSSTYSGGASIDIAWIDGPRIYEVDAVVGRYQGADFDGMIDLKTHREPLLMAGPDGELREVRCGADFIFTHREYSPEFLRAEAERCLREEWGLDPAEVELGELRSHESFRFKGRVTAWGTNAFENAATLTVGGPGGKTFDRELWDWMELLGWYRSRREEEA